MQKLVDEINEIAPQIYNLPIELACNDNQFSKKPPSGHKIYKISESEKRNMRLTSKQELIVNSLTKEEILNCRLVINKLNDLGQLLEDKYINYKVFLGKYHTMIIRLVSILEPVRRFIESDSKNGIGGNYGQRLLRMRYRAILFNYSYPKHRNVDIILVSTNKNNETNRRIILNAKEESASVKLVSIYYKLKLFLSI